MKLDRFVSFIRGVRNRFGDEGEIEGWIMFRFSEFFLTKLYLRVIYSSKLF